jgi:hypothetical protein
MRCQRGPRVDVRAAFARPRSSLFSSGEREAPRHRAHATNEERPSIRTCLPTMSGSALNACLQRWSLNTTSRSASLAASATAVNDWPIWTCTPSSVKRSGVTDAVSPHLPIDEVRGCDVEAAFAFRRLRFPQSHQSFRCAVRKRPQQNHIDHASRSPAREAARKASTTRGGGPAAYLAPTVGFAPYRVRGSRSSWRLLVSDLGSARSR